jgi:hypothetical protein
LAAALFALIGVAMLYTATGGEKLLSQPDALFRFTSGTMLVLCGLLHIGFSVSLFLTRDLMCQGFQTLWMGLNYIVYHAGMSLLNVVPPYRMIQLLAWKFGLLARVSNGCWNLFSAYLLMGSILFLMLEWRRLEQVQSEAYLKHWTETRD